MTEATTSAITSRGRVEKRTVAMVSVLAASAMTLLKLVTGLLTGSLGMLSDAAHSGIDLAGAGLTFLSVRVCVCGEKERDGRERDIRERERMH